MNGITFIALVFIGYCIIKFAFKVIEATAQDIAREQGGTKLNRYHTDMDRLNKRNAWNVNEGWK
jgi:hypothetical protein